MTYLDNLNPKQKEAVTTNLKKVLVIAGAGSGKTRVLITRIKYLLDNGAHISDIVAFTFTNKAAIEMKSRIGSLTPNITTFHSYAYQQLLADNNYLKLGFKERPQIITDTEKSKIIRTILKDYKDKYSNIPFIKAISLIKNKTPIKTIKEEDEALLHLVYLKYQETLKQNNLIDFDDMIPLFIELANNDEYFNYGIQLPYVLVDECQDINQVQYDLIKIISKEFQNIFMVGDDDQLIYSFRSSDIKILNDFKDNCDKVIVLNENYRSNKDILEHANSLVSHNAQRLTKTLKANIDTKAIIEYKDYASTSDEAIAVINKIKKLFKGGIAPKDIAILYRNNYESLMLERELKKANINYNIYGASPLFESEAILKITAAIRIIFKQNEDYNFINLINIEQYEKINFKEAYLKQSKPILEFAKTYSNNKIKELAINLLNLRQELNNIPDAITFYNKLLDAIKFKSYYKNNKKAINQMYNFLDILAQIPIKDIALTINELMIHGDNNNKSNYKDTISLLTIHKAKGLEFKVIFLISINEGIIPRFEAKGLELEEERRLCYVALTRAKERLYLSSSIIHFINGKLYKMKPSKFLIEANFIKQSNFLGRYFYN